MGEFLRKEKTQKKEKTPRQPNQPWPTARIPRRSIAKEDRKRQEKKKRRERLKSFVSISPAKPYNKKEENTKKRGREPGAAYPEKVVKPDIQSGRRKTG